MRRGEQVRVLRPGAPETAVPRPVARAIRLQVTSEMQERRGHREDRADRMREVRRDVVAAETVRRVTAAPKRAQVA
jgi:hypothetical protein